MFLRKIEPSQLLALGCLGAISLWGVAFFNGTLDNMNSAIARGTFPDGRLLRSKYTGFGPLDGRIKYLVAFYEVLSNGTTLGPRLLFVDINFVIAATNIWLFVDSRRRGHRNMALRHPVPFMVLWLGLGAAFLQPLYFWLHTQSKAVVRDPTVPYNEAIALFVSALPAFLTPLLLFLPTYLGMSTYEHHGYIGAFLGSPFLLVVSCLTVVGLLIPWHGVVSQKSKLAPNADKPWIVAVFVLVGVLSAAVHLICIGTALTSGNPDMSLHRVYVPAPGRMHSVWQQTSNFTSSAQLPPAYSVLYEGYHLFTQLDYIIVSLACVVYTYCMLQYKAGDLAKRGQSMSTAELRTLCLVGLGSLVIGPAASGSFALAIREEKLRKFYIVSQARDLNRKTR